jgi:hypothetical protein
MTPIVLFILSLLLVAVTRSETTFTKVTFISFFALFFFYYFIQLLSDTRIKVSRTQYLLIFFIIYMFFNLWIAIENDIPLIDWISSSRKYLILLLIFPFARYLNQSVRYEISLNAYILAAFFIAIYVLLWWMLFKGDSTTAGISSTMPIWAFIILFSIIAGLPDRKFGIFGKFFLYFFAVIFLLYFLSESRRSAIILVITGVIVTLYIAGKAKSKIGISTGRHGKSKKILALILFALVIYGGISANVRFTTDRFVHSILSRVAISYSFFPLIVDNPVLGVGYGYKKTESMIYKGIEIGEEKAIHNLYIDILAHSGIVGLFLFLLFYLSVLRDAYRAIYSSRSTLEIWIFSGFIGVLVSLLIFFMTSSRGARPEVFTLIALIASVSYNTKLNYKFNKRNR